MQDFALRLLESGNRVTGGGLSQSFVRDILTVIKITCPHVGEIRLPYEPPKEIEIFNQSERSGRCDSHPPTASVSGLAFRIESVCADIRHQLFQHQKSYLSNSPPAVNAVMGELDPGAAHVCRWVHVIVRDFNRTDRVPSVVGR